MPPELSSGATTEYSTMLDVAALLALAIVAPQVTAADTTVVRGTVFDSIAAQPVARASIQLVRADSGSATRAFAATTDSAGQFIIRGVPRGRYVTGFFHPMLDSLGLELLERVVDVAGDTASLLLATPSPLTLIRGFCGDSSGAMLPTLLFGDVHDARTESTADNATVTVAWAEAEQSASGLDIVERQGQVPTRRGGFFAICGVPTEAALSVRVSRDKDTTLVHTRISSTGVLHLTLFIGAAGTTGRIVGRVTDRWKKPVGTANASAAGRIAMVNSGGRFTLDNVPTGTQSVEVHAIGYAPATLLVNVADRQEADVDVALDRVVALPTVESRATAAADHLAKYAQAKRTDPTGARFIEPSRLEGYPATQSACMLVSLLRGASMCRQLERCDAFFLNGTRVVYHVDDVDADDIIGVEVFGKYWPSTYEPYRLARVPITCGIVVFTRCPGIELRCGSNPASQGVRRPDG
jgi:hypothetical protein